MKKSLVYILSVILGASIPIYFLLIWEPLKSEEALSDNIVNTESSNSNNENLDYEYKTIKLKQSENSNGLLNYLEGNRKESANSILRKLSIVDLVKVNDCFEDKSNKEKIKKGIELIKKRLSYEEYEVFINIIKDQVDLDDL